MATIELDNLTKRYPDGFAAVTGLDLAIADGECLVLVGPSGCGKSTALRMIAGLEEITSGELRIAGEVVNDLAPKERDIAMVFQNYALYPHMTVRQNMSLALRIARVDKATIRRRVDETAAVLGLTEHLDRKPANLSGGQRQRVAMGRAIVREPKAFLMDEPLSNLDAKLRVEMRAEVARLQARLSSTMVYVTHDQTEALTLGDRVAVLRGGVLQQVGAPAELYDDPANLFVAGFIGSPAMNFLPGRLEDGAVRTAIGAVPLADELRRRVETAGDGMRDVIVGLRPEDLEDAALCRDPSAVVEVAVELVESVGSESYVHFAHEGTGIESEQLADLAVDAGVGDIDRAGRGVARLGRASALRAGDTARLAVDAARVHLFDRRDGRALTSARREAIAA